MQSPKYLQCKPFSSSTTLRLNISKETGNILMPKLLRYAISTHTTAHDPLPDPQLCARKCLENTSSASPMTSCKLCLCSVASGIESWPEVLASSSLIMQVVGLWRRPISVSVANKNIAVSFKMFQIFGFPNRSITTCCAVVASSSPNCTEPQNSSNKQGDYCQDVAG